MSSSDAANPARHRARGAYALLIVATLVLPTTGCAFVARAITAAEAISLLRDLASAVPTTRTVSGSDVIDGVIAGTHGSGLRLKDRPGGHRVAAFPDGTKVRIECHTNGPRVTGPTGPTSTWSRVRTPDGRRGYMSDAYLRIDHVDSSVPAC